MGKRGQKKKPYKRERSGFSSVGNSHSNIFHDNRNNRNGNRYSPLASTEKEDRVDEVQEKFKKSCTALSLNTEGKRSLSDLVKDNIKNEFSLSPTGQRLQRHKPRELGELAQILMERPNVSSSSSSRRRRFFSPIVGERKECTTGFNNNT